MDLPFPFGTLTLTLVVDHGVVYCPVRRHDVDLERCFECPSRVTLDEAEGTLRCSPILAALTRSLPET